MQGYEPPHNSADNDGWALVEFWSSDVKAIQAFVDHINAMFSSVLGVIQNAD